MEPLVVYIIGDNRSGSTLLDYLLSSHPEAVSLGELHHLYDYYYGTGFGKSRAWMCSCGKTLSRCEFWNPILKRLQFNEDFQTRLKIRKGKSSFLKRLFKRESIIEQTLMDERVAKRGAKIADNCWSIYQTVSDYTGKSIIVDSSKNPYEAFFLYKQKKGNIRFLLLDRGICDVSYSKMRREKELQAYYAQTGNTIYRHLLGTYAVFVQNSFIANRIQESSKENIIKMVNYMDLAENSQRTMEEICLFLGVKQVTFPTATNEYKTVSHVLGGSPTRYDKRPIQPDNRWKSFYVKKPVAKVIGGILQVLYNKHLSNKRFV